MYYEYFKDPFHLKIVLYCCSVLFVVLTPLWYKTIFEFDKSWKFQPMYYFDSSPVVESDFVYSCHDLESDVTAEAASKSPLGVTD